MVSQGSREWKCECYGRTWDVLHNWNLYNRRFGKSKKVLPGYRKSVEKSWKEAVNVVSKSDRKGYSKAKELL